jgi:hypothetical protein
LDRTILQITSNPSCYLRVLAVTFAKLVSAFTFLMTDAEFDLLDELYFVTPFRVLLEKTGLPAAELQAQLGRLLEQGLVRYYWPDPDTELAYEPTSFGALSRDASYLASKEGLLQHNTR